MSGKVSALLGRHGRLILVLAVLVGTAVQLGRLVASEREITGGKISLPLDDSFIYMQYARAIAEGHPFVYTPGNAPTSGSTSLWYPLLLLPPHLLRLPPEACIFWVLAIGALLFAASALLLIRLGNRLGGPVGGALSALLFLASPHMLWGYFSGMEIALYGTVLLAAVDAYIRERPSARFQTLRWWLFALAGARPEGAILCGMFAILIARDRWRASRVDTGLRFRSGVLLLPLLAAALPFLVNLAVSGSIESTSSQAKSILAEPYQETRTEYLSNTPTICMNIAQIYLSQLLLDAQSRPLPYVMLASGLGVLFFVVFAFRPRRGAWNGGVSLLALVMTGIVVNSIPVYWQLHLFRYQQGLFPLVLLLVGAGWGRMAWWAWTRGPGWIRVPVAGLSAVAPLAVLLPILWISNGQMIHFYGLNCENILNQQIHLGRWMNANLPKDAVVGVNDAGALAYYGRRSTIDLVGLTSAGFARVYRSGMGCLFEHTRRLPAHQLPTHFAVYPDWFDYWQESGIFGPEIYRAHLALNTICGGTDMVVYPALWSRLSPPDTPVQGAAELDTLHLTDSIDLAWLEDERRHEWSAEPESKDILQRYRYADVPGVEVTDAGRIVRRAERFRATVTPGKDLFLVMRTDAWFSTSLHVMVDGKPAGLWSFALSETAWVEPRFRVEGRLLTRTRPEFVLVREETGAGGKDVSARNYSAYRFWLYQ